MAVLLGEMLSAHSGPLQVVTFTYRPYEASFAGQNLPNNKPANPQAYVTFSPYSTYGFSINPLSMASCCQVTTVIYAYITNYDSTSRTLYFEVYINGAKYASSATMANNTAVKFCAYPLAAFWLHQGAVVEVYFWTNSPSAVLDYMCIYTLPTRLSPKPGYLFRDVTYDIIQVPPISLGYGYSVKVDSAGQLRYTLPTNSDTSLDIVIANKVGQVVIPFVPTSSSTLSVPQGYGLFRAGLGDITSLQYNVTSTTPSRVPGAYTPASISFRVTPIRVA